jgi:hypothetical protein
MPIKNLNFDLHNNEFIGFTRRTYTDQYTSVPAVAYSTDLAETITAFEKALGLAGQDLKPLTIISSEGYAQRLSCPRVYKKDSGLVLRYDRELIPVERVDNDGEITYKVCNSAAVITVFEDKPILQCTLPKGVKVFVPFHMAYEEGTKTPTLEVIEALEQGVYSLVSEAPGSGGSTSFSALKHLPLGRYTVLKTEGQQGKFGPKIKVTLECPEELEFICTTSTDGTWSSELITVQAGAKIIVDANTSLQKALSGLTLEAKDNVILHVVSKRIDEDDDNKVYVTANFDFSKSDNLAQALQW